MKRTIAAMIAGLALAGGITGVAEARSSARRVPSGLTGHKLSAVENKLDAKGIGFKTVGGGLFGIVIKSDWGVCATEPGAGKPIHGPVKLVVGHFTCGA